MEFFEGVFLINGIVKTHASDVMIISLRKMIYLSFEVMETVACFDILFWKRDFKIKIYKEKKIIQKKANKINCKAIFKITV